jgi:hypothetical protein
MNKAKLKSYAPQARQNFIAAVTARANLLGLSEKAGQLEVAPAQTQGDVTVIAGQAWPAKVAIQRDQLITRMRREGFAHTCEAVAYTWFNRFAALRYMELHDYLGHGHRALSSAEGNLPDILTHAADLAQGGADSGLPGLNAAKVLELKLAGNRDGELYRMLLVAQCNALNGAMPFLFERIGDDTELLMPDNLLLSDSVLAKMVVEIDEEDWAEIEIIGWLYQFYIADKKEQVIRTVVKTEDIPAATQLFTPNWIVKYMVQNSLGAQWLATYPTSPLRMQMEYYIAPAVQTDEVDAQLTAMAPIQLNPEELTLIDPACGSGHILVEAYDLLKAIYLERGYRQRDVPQLILEKNLFGLDIDERAAQLSGFALLMKGRADDRRLFERGVKLNIIALVDSTGIDMEGLANEVDLSEYGLKPEDFTELNQLFEHATTFGSLIRVSSGLAQNLPALKRLSEAPSPNLFESETLKSLRPLVRQAELLAAQYDAVVANPPYLNARSFCPELKTWLKISYAGYDKDLFSAFIIRLLELTKERGFSGVMTSFVWMFIASFEELRATIISRHSIGTLVQLHYDAFVDAKAHVCTFTMRKALIEGYKSSFVRLADFPGVENQGPKTLEAIHNRRCGWFYESPLAEFRAIPGSPLAYWASENTRKAFREAGPLSKYSKPLIGMRTGDNDRFLRRWHEVSILTASIAGSRGAKWFPYSKGGFYRRWFGNNEHLVNWLDNGDEIKENTLLVYPQLDRENLGWKISNESS